ncbi:hypothetical protein PR048_001327 [Dryococelus australis]|uniref:Receptor ligand binding region domain-containing protein n=1 Tax=Dryococelus australis TaxID=614101 RepID=A0ABQ9II15_9NEOP|nr:hypothetical protein PR048_001327 [Dryococelus australis]
MEILVLVKRPQLLIGLELVVKAGDMLGPKLAVVVLTRHLWFDIGCYNAVWHINFSPCKGQSLTSFKTFLVDLSFTNTTLCYGTALTSLDLCRYIVLVVLQLKKGYNKVWVLSGLHTWRRRTNVHMASHGEHACDAEAQHGDGGRVCISLMQRSPLRLLGGWTGRQGGEDAGAPAHGEEVWNAHSPLSSADEVGGGLKSPRHPKMATLLRACCPRCHNDCCCSVLVCFFHATICIITGFFLTSERHQKVVVAGCIVPDALIAVKQTVGEYGDVTHLGARHRRVAAPKLLELETQDVLRVLRAGLPDVSFGSTSPALSDRKEFPLFFRTVAPDSSHNPARLAFVRRFGWDSVTALSQDEDVYTMPNNAGNPQLYVPACTTSDIPRRQTGLYGKPILFAFVICNLLLNQAVNDLVTELERANITCPATVTFSETDYEDQMRTLKVRPTMQLFEWIRTTTLFRLNRINTFQATTRYQNTKYSPASSYDYALQMCQKTSPSTECCPQHTGKLPIVAPNTIQTLIKTEPLLKAKSLCQYHVLKLKSHSIMVLNISCGLAEHVEEALQVKSCLLESPKVECVGGVASRYPADFSTPSDTHHVMHWVSKGRGESGVLPHPHSAYTDSACVHQCGSRLRSMSVSANQGMLVQCNEPHAQPTSQKSATQRTVFRIAVWDTTITSPELTLPGESITTSVIHYWIIQFFAVWMGLQHPDNIQESSCYSFTAIIDATLERRLAPSRVKSSISKTSYLTTPKTKPNPIQSSPTASESKFLKETFVGVPNTVVSMEKCRNEGAGGMGDIREYPPASGIIRHDSHMLNSGVTRPGIEPGSPSVFICEQKDSVSRRAPHQYQESYCSVLMQSGRRVNLTRTLTPLCTAHHHEHLRYHRSWRNIWGTAMWAVVHTTPALTTVALQREMVPDLIMVLCGGTHTAFQIPFARRTKSARTESNAGSVRTLHRRQSRCSALIVLPEQCKCSERPNAVISKEIPHFMFLCMMTLDDIRVAGYLHKPISSPPVDLCPKDAISNHGVLLVFANQSLAYLTTTGFAAPACPHVALLCTALHFTWSCTHGLVQVPRIHKAHIPAVVVLQVTAGLTILGITVTDDTEWEEALPSCCTTTAMGSLPLILQNIVANCQSELVLLNFRDVLQKRVCIPKNSPDAGQCRSPPGNSKKWRTYVPKETLELVLQYGHDSLDHGHPGSELTNNPPVLPTEIATLQQQIHKQARINQEQYYAVWLPAWKKGRKTLGGRPQREARHSTAEIARCDESDTDPSVNNSNSSVVPQQPSLNDSLFDTMPLWVLHHRNTAHPIGE